MQGNLAAFDKKKEFASLTTDDTDSPAEKIAAAYDKKSSFFDTLSSNVADKLAAFDLESRRSKAAEERNLNAETFGATALQNDRHRGYNRGRGGRGRGRGGNRGRGGAGGGGGYRAPAAGGY
jgi:hypothetical protein